MTDMQCLLRTSFIVANCREVIKFVSGTDPYTWKGYVLAVTLLLVNIIQALATHTYFKYTYIAGMRARSAVITAVYRKVGRNH